MKNLAGYKECDHHIALELERFRINIHKLERVGNTEVPYTIYGELDSFTFKRAWYYYVVEGALHLSIAKELYADPVGKTDIRAAGDCGCRPPEQWAKFYNISNGKQLLSLEEKAKTEEYAKSDSEFMRQTAKKMLAEYEFVPDPTVGFGFVDVYHIDSEIGLRLFADTIRKYFNVAP